MSKPASEFAEWKRKTVNAVCVVSVASALSLVLLGCTNQGARQSMKSQECIQKFDSPALRDWIERVARGQSTGTVSLNYTVDLPFDDAKRIENALARLPGKSQNVRFDKDGTVHVMVFGAVPPFEAIASADTSGNSDVANSLPVAQTLCGAVKAIHGSLTDVSVQTVGYTFDDGKLHAAPVP